ncbi:50S ribosomal protein L29 [Spirochaeta lutea]|uniref:Large ribosomal subunit protein uL29 n=1 Tax=Spirochaeta lutea TaxID=1480694 RepID=A0A098QW02_9SPIO|nr:50S ribosomal protein L29 [Spirochaeta lutea]KGE70682.1 50S ribosomal protein L29 [Spirochaeta lutea]
MKDSYKDLTLEELIQKKDELQKKYFDLRFNSVIGYLDNPLEKRVIKRKIARVNTLIHNFDNAAESAKASRK